MAENHPQNSSDFAHLYKFTARTIELTQQEHRELYLREQRERRHSLVDKHRDFSNVFLDDDGEDEFQPSQDMDVDQVVEKNRDKFFLMRSEWLTMVPPDLEENWLVKLAPEGFRVLLIAKRGRTVILNERGRVLVLKTNLPGGGTRGRGLTVLDCIYNKPAKTFFILDCLYWNTLSMLDSETSFRFYWLKNQFDESTKLCETNKPHKLFPLEFISAKKDIIQTKLFSPIQIEGQIIPYKGIVFYHKELIYTFNQTPLLGWLNCYMIPEKLAIDVPEDLLNKMPEGYECVEKYLETYEEKSKSKHYFRNRRHNANAMEM